MSEAKNSGRLPAFQFYPADWRKDPGVQSLDFETRGIWWEIICLLHESDERGVLLLNGNPMPEDALCRLLGLDNQKLQSALSILLTYGVAKRREDGAIYNSRMVRDESLRKKARENGHQGGNPALKGDYKAPGFVYAIRRASDNAIKIGIAQNVTNRFNKIKSTHKGDDLTLIGVMPSQDMGQDEAALHQEFKGCCIMGEWFKIEGNNLEKLFTLMGLNKGETRASSSSSISSSSSPSGTNTPNPKPAAPATPALSEDFEKFWKLYPRKEAKAEAVKAWRKVNPADVAAIHAALPIHAQSVGWQKEDGRFIPLPASWLNARRWEDELKTAVRSDVTPAQADYEDPPFLSNDEAIFHKP